jgi:hypothetical protein
MWAFISAVILLFALTQYRQIFSLPFLNDDYIFLEKVRALPFASLWARTAPTFGYYRPWSREFHYWLLEHCFGTAELPFHLVNVVLWLSVLLLYFKLVASILDRPTALIALAGVAASGVWGSPLLWVAGAQDLWMVLFGLLFLLSVRSERPALTSCALILALLSKETFVVLPAIGLAYLVLVRGERAWQALRHSAINLGVLVAWGVLHPTFLKLISGHSYQAAESQSRPSPFAIAARTVLVQVNLDPLPHPEGGWSSVVLVGASGALILAVLLVPLVLPRPADGLANVRRGGEDLVRVRRFAVAWTLFGWLPLLAPSVGWHAYYGVFGTLGLWVLAATYLGAVPRTALMVVALLGFLREARAATPSWDWGTDWYQQRAGALLKSIRFRLQAAHPRFPHGSRLFFARIPNNIGFLNADGPAVRIWYRDPTLRATYYSRYERRSGDTSLGSDYFFRFDSTQVLVEIVPGPEDIAAAVAENPNWLDDHFKLAVLFLRTGQPGRAGEEFQKIATAFPSRRDCALYAGVCLEAVGRVQEARDLYTSARQDFPDEASFERAVEQLKRTLPRTPG